MKQVFKTQVVTVCVELEGPDSQLQRGRETEIEAETNGDTDTERDKDIESTGSVWTIFQDETFTWNRAVL